MKPILIIIDMQNDYFRQESLAAQQVDLADATNELIRLARERSCPIAWVVTQFAADLSDAFLEMRKKSVSTCIEGSEGARIIPALDPEPGDRTIVKKRFSAFCRTILDSVLRELEATHLILAGINTHACIRTSAIDAYQRDYEVILAHDCIGSYDREHHDISWRYMNGKIGTGLSNHEIGTLLDARETGRPGR